MALTEKEIGEIAAQLMEAERTCQAIEPISKRYQGMDYSDAYAIQMKTMEMKAAEGGLVVGRKIGQTSREMQELIGIYEPDFGTIMHNKVYPEGKAIPAASMIIPRIEAEVGFLLKDDLKGPGINVLNVLAATEGVFPLLEVKDSRVVDPHNTTIEDSIADNATSGVVIIGGKLTPLSSGLDLRTLGMTFEHNGVVVGTATGVEVMSNPAEAVAWLVNKLSEFNIKLGRGQFVMSGGLTKAIAVEPGDSFRASFDLLGSVSAHFV